MAEEGGRSIDVTLRTMHRCSCWGGHSLRRTGVTSGPSSYAAQTSMSIRRHRDGSSSDGSNVHPKARKFTLAQLSAATDGFSDSNLVGEGGFGKVYRGLLDLEDDDRDSSGAAPTTAVAVKQLRRGGVQGSREFAVECGMLMALRHPNIVSLVGYCAEAQERLLVYPFLPRRSLDAHLFFQPADSSPPLDWNTRVRIARGAARALRYLHEAVTPPVIYRDLKPANILLDDDFTPKLSDLGLARLGPAPGGDATHVSTRVMGTHGYCAPDYARTGRLTVKSDVYSFGVVLLEIITGRRAFDAAEDEEDRRRLLVWAMPYLADVRRGYRRLADPALGGRYPRRALYQLTVVAQLCLQDKPNLRPTMSEVTRAIDHVASHPWQDLSLPTGALE